MGDHEFRAPQLVVEAVPRELKLNHLPGQEEVLGRLTIAEAGCGAGLVGIELAILGVNKMDGLDISQGMLHVAHQPRYVARCTSAKVCWTLRNKLERTEA
ncbi:hypothetical protein BDU57DRAFT_521567 [Ampelomyces quisqualis]|uniref:Methyltransferase domain-containing protein n=1 Tax=Ampelomyces quisqualis TaxID=50730 RepID=A0A6A5QC30_AMPQU|nr:hypothetical protein BDU57DRAFT_521567 [Ampelomyces quisqualis]